MVRNLSRISSVTAVLAFAFGLMSACSSDKSGDDSGATGTAGSSNAHAGSSGSSSTSSSGASSTSTGGSTPVAGSSGQSTAGSTSTNGGTGPISTEACPGLPFDGAAGESSGGEGGAADAACVGVSEEAESIAVDMFIMMDRSTSMGYTLPNSKMTRWDALKAAVQSFVDSPSAGNIGAGIGFFSMSGGGDDALDCNVDNYAKPNVAITPLATGGKSLVDAIEATPPAGLTPTVPALQGAITYAKAWHTAHADRATIVVLVTDGYPTQCGSDPSLIAAAAMAGYQDAAHIRTYVIGVGDIAKFNLDNYAQAGGTQKAYLTDQTDASNTFLQALLNITDSKLACQYAIPKPTDPKMQLDPNKVQVVYTPASGEALEVPKVTSLGACANAPNGGWYYDNPASPSSISVCPCTCSSFAAGRVDVRVGCAPRISIR